MIFIQSILVGLGIVAVAFFVLALVIKSHELLEYSEFTVNIGLIIGLVVLTYLMLGGIYRWCTFYC